MAGEPVTHFHRSTGGEEAGWPARGSLGQQHVQSSVCRLSGPVDPRRFLLVGRVLAHIPPQAGVEHFSGRRAAERDARSVEGVYEVINHLKVNLLGADRREDDEIRGAALQTLIWDAEVPSDSIDVKVHDGWVTLKGDVSFQFQSDAVYDGVSRLSGVAGVTNGIKVTNP